MAKAVWLADAETLGADVPQIYARQNQPTFIRLMRASSRCHALAGRVHAARVCVALGLLVAGPLIAVFEPSASEGIAAVSAGWAALGAFVFKGWEVKLKRRGAQAQEVFDCELFSLNWNAAVAGRRPAPEELHDWAKKQSSEKLKNWYPDVSGAQPPLDALLCQRSSLVWGRRNHEIYARVILGLAAGWVILNLLMGVALNLGLGEFLVRLFLPSLPALLLAGSTYEEHVEQAEAKGAVERTIDNVWRDSLDRGDRPGGTMIRQIQDRIFELRLGARPPAPLYRWRRERDEAAMVAAVEELVADLPPTLRV